MVIVNELSDDAVLRELGNRVASNRIAARMTQEELARRAGVSKRSIERLEKGEEGVRLQIVIAVARVLRCLGGLNAFIPMLEISPYDIVAKHKPQPKRVRSVRRPTCPFKWGE